MTEKKKKDEEKPIVIAHVSDLHAGSPYFVDNLLSRTIMELNELDPDLTVITGDITNEGFKQEFYLANNFLKKMHFRKRMILPGNHDARNVGYVHFEELWGERSGYVELSDVSVTGIDSTEPDLDNGRVGRYRQQWLHDQFRDSNSRFKILALHHHLLPVPGTGRERNIVLDAGDVLEMLIERGVNLVLCGHKHVPYVWRLENLFVVNAGTVASLRLRGNIKPCYNIVEIWQSRVKVFRKYPFGGQDLIIDLDTETGAYRKNIKKIDEQLSIDT